MEVHQLKEEIKHFIQNYTIEQGGMIRKDQKAIEADCYGMLHAFGLQ